MHENWGIRNDPLKYTLEDEKARMVHHRTPLPTKSSLGSDPKSKHRTSFVRSPSTVHQKYLFLDSCAVGDSKYREAHRLAGTYPMARFTMIKRF